MDLCQLPEDPVSGLERRVETPILEGAMNVLVVGVTGLLGAEISRRLKAGGHAVSGLVRPGSSREATVRELGVEVRSGDLKNPASLEAACQGVEAIVSTATAVTSGGSGNSLAAVDGQRYASLLEAAKAAGVRRFVYVSASPKYGESSPLVLHKRATERLVKASGLDYVILQPSFFMDIWFSPALGWDLKAGKAQIFGAGDAPISYIALGDVAAYAVAVLEASGAKKLVIPLGGPEAISPREALAVVEKVVGRKFKVTTLPGFVPRLASVMLKPFNPKLSSLMGLGAETLTGDAIDPAGARAIAAVRFTSVAEWAERTTRAG
jgi:uncharacterized protein YbjT (DUF2867 family)